MVQIDVVRFSGASILSFDLQPNEENFSLKKLRSDVYEKLVQQPDLADQLPPHPENAAYFHGLLQLVCDGEILDTECEQAPAAVVGAIGNERIVNVTLAPFPETASLNIEQMRKDLAVLRHQAQGQLYGDEPPIWYYWTPEYHLYHKHWKTCYEPWQMELAVFRASSNELRKCLNLDGEAESGDPSMHETHPQLPLLRYILESPKFGEVNRFFVDYMVQSSDFNPPAIS